MSWDARGGRGEGCRNRIAAKRLCVDVDGVYGVLSTCLRLPHHDTVLDKSLQTPCQFVLVHHLAWCV